MKEISSSEEFSEKHDYRSMLTIEIDGKRAFRFLDGEPEDANLGRDFNDVYTIVEAMEKAYEAGMACAGFEVERVEVDDFD